MSALPSSSHSIPSKDAVAQHLADSNCDNDSGITAVFRLVSPTLEAIATEPIKLLEVNANTTANGIVPVYFAPHPASGLHYAAIIIEVHPSEWSEMRAGRMTLPHGWTLDRQLH